MLTTRPTEVLYVLAPQPGAAQLLDEAEPTLARRPSPSVRTRDGVPVSDAKIVASGDTGSSKTTRRKILSDLGCPESGFTRQPTREDRLRALQRRVDAVAHNNAAIVGIDPGRFFLLTAHVRTSDQDGQEAAREYALKSTATQQPVSQRNATQHRRRNKYAVDLGALCKKEPELIAPEADDAGDFEAQMRVRKAHKLARVFLHRSKRWCEARFSYRLVRRASAAGVGAQADRRMCSATSRSSSKPHISSSTCAACHRRRPLARLSRARRLQTWQTRARLVRARGCTAGGATRNRLATWSSSSARASSARALACE